MAEQDFTGSPVHVYLHRPMTFQGKDILNIAGKCGGTLGNLIAIAQLTALCDTNGAEVHRQMLGKTIMINTADIRLVVLTTVGAPPPTEVLMRR